MPPHNHNDSSSPLSTAGFWQNLFSSDDFMPRLQCGAWTRGEVWLHTSSDFFIWTAYLAIPLVLVYFWYERRTGLPFRSLFLLFGIFIVACGTTHLMDIIMFYKPMYRFAGLIKLVTAAASWGTVMALISCVPKMLVMRSPDDLEAEVQERTAQLQAANLAKDELLERESVARHEAELARHQAEEASRAKDEFLMILSHELRTPLNAIQGWASLLQSPQINEGLKQQGLETIERSSWAQARLIDDLLEVSRITAGKLAIETQPVELHSVVEAALASVAPTAQSKEVVLEGDLPPEMLLISGDPARLQQIVWNLLANAVKFTPKGGQVRIALRREGSSAQIEVSDTGEGIGTELLPYVFDRFRQADSSATRRHGGLGLGLAIVRHLTELHGGSVTAKSEGAGKGSTFTVNLPLRAVDSPRLPEERKTKVEIKHAATESHALSNLNILVLDDENEARTLVCTILELHGATTRSAESANEAREIMTQWVPDLIVSDVGMPGETGHEFIRKIRESGRGKETLPALALTAYASPKDHEAAMNAGFNSHLSKPVMPAALITEIALLTRRASKP